MKSSTQYMPEIVGISKKDMQMILEGKIRNHKLRNNASLHFGEEELEEYYAFRDFLKTKNFNMIFNLKGSDNI